MRTLLVFSKIIGPEGQFFSFCKRKQLHQNYSSIVHIKRLAKPHVCELKQCHPKGDLSLSHNTSLACTMHTGAGSKKTRI